jgi:hypothetical protein
MSTKLVAKFLSGEIKKGVSYDFLLIRETFHLQLESDPVNQEEIRLSDLKAVFFVEDYSGDSGYSDNKNARRPTYQQRVSVKFQDGEEIVGYTDDDLDENQVIRLVPADPLSNNNLIFVVKKNAKSIKSIEQ